MARSYPANRFPAMVKEAFVDWQNVLGSAFVNIESYVLCSDSEHEDQPRDYKSWKLERQAAEDWQKRLQDLRTKNPGIYVLRRAISLEKERIEMENRVHVPGFCHPSSRAGASPDRLSYEEEGSRTGNFPDAAVAKGGNAHRKLMRKWVTIERYVAMMTSRSWAPVQDPGA